MSDLKKLHHKIIRYFETFDLENLGACPWTFSSINIVAFNLLLVSEGIRPSCLFGIQSKVNDVTKDEYLGFINGLRIENLGIHSRYLNLTSNWYTFFYNKDLLDRQALDRSINDYNGSEESLNHIAIGSLLGIQCPTDLKNVVAKRKRSEEVKMIKYWVHTDNDKKYQVFEEFIDERFEYKIAYEKRMKIDSMVKKISSNFRSTISITPLNS